MANTALDVVLLGPPGSGKGTQAERLADHFNLEHLSTGILIRNQIENKTDFGLKALEYTLAGNYVPDDLITPIVLSYVKDGPQNYLFDGFPRTVKQAEALSNHLASIGRRIDHALYLKIEDVEVLPRITGRRVHPASGRVYHTMFNPPKQEGLDDETGEPLIQRPDDTEAVAKVKLSEYHTNTDPLLAWFADRDLLRLVPAALPLEKVWKHVRTAVESEVPAPEGLTIIPDSPPPELESPILFSHPPVHQPPVVPSHPPQPRPGYNPNLGFELFDRIFEDADENGDGVISWEEFLDYFSRTGLTEPELRRIFAIVDADGQGDIDIDEFRLFFKAGLAPYLPLFQSAQQMQSAVVLATLAQQQYRDPRDAWRVKFFFSETMKQLESAFGKVAHALDALVPGSVTKKERGRDSEATIPEDIGALQLDALEHLIDQLEQGRPVPAQPHDPGQSKRGHTHDRLASHTHSAHPVPAHPAVPPPTHAAEAWDGPARLRQDRPLEPATVHRGVVYLSSLTSTAAALGSPEAQMSSVLQQLDHHLARLHSGRQHILTSTLYLREISHLARIDAVWQAWLQHQPAPPRTVVEATLPNPTLLVLLSVTAAQDLH